MPSSMVDDSLPERAARMRKGQYTRRPFCISHNPLILSALSFPKGRVYRASGCQKRNETLLSLVRGERYPVHFDPKWRQSL